MVFMKLFLGILLGIISLVLGTYALIGEFLLPAILTVVLLFPLVAVFPPAKHRENIWMFVLATPMVIPLCVSDWNPFNESSYWENSLGNHTAYFAILYRADHFGRVNPCVLETPAKIGVF